MSALKGMLTSRHPPPPPPGTRLVAVELVLEGGRRHAHRDDGGQTTAGTFHVGFLQGEIDDDWV
jgi:hypothetical protein